MKNGKVNNIFMFINLANLIMKQTITIAINDTNRYFSEGLRRGVLNYFLGQGLQVHFVGQLQSGQADLVFQYVGMGMTSYFCRQTTTARVRRPLFFSIREFEEHRYLSCLRTRERMKCKLEVGVIWRHEQLSDVLERIELAMQQATAHPIEHQCYCNWCGRNALTHRERQVLKAMLRKTTLTEVASLLMLSVKTVSAHKHNAMNKLGLHYNIDLYHWLLNGGLGSEDERIL